MVKIAFWDNSLCERGTSVPYEFLENHYVNEYNMQVDMLFINKNHEFNKIVQDLL